MAQACPSCGYMLPFSMRRLRQRRETGAALPAVQVPSAEDPPEPAAEPAAAEPPELSVADPLEPAAEPAASAAPEASSAAEDTGGEAPHDQDLSDLAAQPVSNDGSADGPRLLPVSTPQPVDEALGEPPDEAQDKAPVKPQVEPQVEPPVEPPTWVAQLTTSSASYGPALVGLPPLPPSAPPDPGDTAPSMVLPALGAVPRRAPEGLPSLTGPTPPALGSALDQQFLSGSTVVMAALNAGTLLKGGRYRLLQRFSSATITGRRGELEPPLFLASDTERPSARVLVQELPIADLAPELSDQLQRRAATRLELAGRQKGTPALVDSFSERHRRFLVVQFPGGERMGDRLRRAGALPEAEVIRIGMQVLDILVGLSSSARSITHGNISPDNILLQPDGRVMLVGFSPALLLRGSGWPERGMVGGARGYAAPEQQRGQAEVRTDLYSLAAVMHYAVTGRDPTEQISMMHDPARRVNPSVSPDLNTLLAQALRPAPAQRFQSVEEMRQALAPLLPASSRLPPAPLGARTKPTTNGRASLSRLPGAVGALRAEMERAPQPPRSWRLLRVALLIGILLGLVGSGVAYLSHPWPQPRHGVPQPTGDSTATALYRQKRIGLSAGEYIFDPQRPDGNLKRQAAQALVGQHLQAALADFQQAMAADHADAEAAIYAADVAIALGHDPAITIVAGVAFGADDAASAAAESELQGVYLAQERINTLALLPGTTQLRVLVANSGAAMDDATAVAGFIAAKMADGNPQRIMGVVGWSEAAQTRLALAVLTGAGVPVVAPAPADPGLSSPFYFALAPSIAQEGGALADGAASALQSRRVLVLDDPANAASTTLALAFVSQAQQQDAATLTVTGQDSFTEGHTSDFTPFVQEALNAGDDTIFIAGTDLDVAHLAQTVAHLWPSYLPSPHILAGSSADTQALLGAGTTQAAQVVRGLAAAMAMVNVAALADAGEWSTVGVPEGVQPTFPVDYTAQFGQTAAPGGLPSPNATAILAYDAVRLLGKAVLDASRGAVLPAPAAVLAALAAVRPERPFQGVGGAIAFHGSGAPVDKALALLGFTPVSGTPAPGAGALSARIVAVLGGVAAFCGRASCPTA